MTYPSFILENQKLISWAHLLSNSFSLSIIVWSYTNASWGLKLVLVVFFLLNHSYKKHGNSTKKISWKSVSIYLSFQRSMLVIKPWVSHQEKSSSLEAIQYHISSWYGFHLILSLHYEIQNLQVSTMEPFVGLLVHILPKIGDWWPRVHIELTKKTPRCQHINPQHRTEEGITRDAMRITYIIWYYVEYEGIKYTKKPLELTFTHFITFNYDIKKM
jgi:hypothetical protein